MPGSAVLLLLLLLSIAPIAAQDSLPAQGEAQTVRLFMDCKAMGCIDLDYLRTEIQFVNWVRNVQDADVYLSVTSLGTGSGGASSELIFTGQGPFEGMTDTLTHVSGFDATMDEMREGVTGIMKIGLMRFVGLTPMAGEIDIGLRRRAPGPEGLPGARAETAPENDPWDFWVFRVQGTGGLGGRTGYRFLRVGGGLSADRVTEDWKVSLRLSSSYNETEYDYEGILSELNVVRSHSLTGTVVKSISPKWSAGLRASARNATFYNFDFAGSLSPVLEYSVFPYSEATRRSLTFEYALEGVYHNYREETIYFKMEDTFLQQSLAGSLQFTRRWGNAYFAMEAGHHLEDIDLHHLSAGGGIGVRLSRGLTLSLSGSASRTKDLTTIAAAAGADLEDILLRRRQLQTDYTYSSSISLSYAFGSIFNNVVNPRMGGGGMLFGMVMM
ncbi:MAG: hypothetical protein MUO50_07565 [Longimicrobiales bacterium]|nr:hypothetical protein [Longimicrobiales bacterium]